MEQCIAGVESSHAWLSMIASRLLQLRPSASVGSSVRCAVSTFHDARNFDPRKAADRYVAACTKVKQAATGQEPASSRYRALFRGDVTPE